MNGFVARFVQVLRGALCVAALAALVSSGHAQETVTILSETFEGNFPADNGWNLIGSPTWDDVDSLHYDGSWCGYCAGSDRSSGPYAPSMDAWMIYGPFSLADAASAQITLMQSYQCESGWDFVEYSLSTDGATFHYGSNRYTGWNQGWDPVTIDMANSPIGNLLGQPQVWFAIIFTSDSSIEQEGAYVDNILIQKTLAPPPQPIISGNIALGAQSAADVEVALDNGGGTTQPNGAGNWSIQVPYGWSGTITPSKPGHGFLPLTRSLSDVTSDQTDQDFQLRNLTISGYVRTSSGSAVGTVRLDISNLSNPHNTPVYTAGNGYYICEVPNGWNGTISVSKTGYTFSPPSRDYSISDGNFVANENYIAIPQNATITVSASPFDAGVTSGGGTYLIGQQVQIGVTPIAGWSFASWNDGNTENPRVISVLSGGATYTASISQDPPPVDPPQTATIIVQADPVSGGSVAGNGTYAVNSQQQLSATAYPGWTFVEWNDGNTANPRTITVELGGATYTANFSQSASFVPTGTVGDTRRPIFSWPAVSGASRYSLQIYRYGRLFRSVTVNGTDWLSTRDIPVGSYTWRTGAKLVGIRTLQWSDWVAFDRQAILPAKEEVTAPVGSVTGKAQTYGWAYDGQATKYEIWIQRNGSTWKHAFFPVKALDAQQGTVLRRIAGHVSGSTYTWWVRAVNLDGNGEWSEHVSFTVTGY